MMASIGKHTTTELQQKCTTAIIQNNSLNLLFLLPMVIQLLVCTYMSGTYSSKDGITWPQVSAQPTKYLRYYPTINLFGGLFNNSVVTSSSLSSWRVVAPMPSSR